jgi:hypothetical protein
MAKEIIEITRTVILAMALTIITWFAAQGNPDP